jgi:RNA polymerase primary sigma factor
MREYRGKVKVRNNLLLSAIEDAGYKTQADFARAIGVGITQLNAMVGLREAPINTDGNFCELAKTLMEALGACPTDLWTEEQLTMKLRKNSARAEVDKYELLAVLGKNASDLIGFDVEQNNEDRLLDIKRAVADKLDSLTPRERKVLQLRFGIDSKEQTLEQIGDMFHMAKESIRHIETKALHKMRHPSRSDQLKPYLEEEL